MKSVEQCIKDLLDGKGQPFGKNYLRYLNETKNLND